MNCKQCGNPIIPGTKNCNVCGAEIEQPPIVNNQNMGMSSVGVEQGNSPLNSTVVPNGGLENNSATQENLSTNQSVPFNPSATIPANNPFLTNQVGVSSTPSSSVTPSPEVVSSLNNSGIVNNTPPQGLGLDSSVNENANVLENNNETVNVNNNVSLEQDVSSQPMNGYSNPAANVVPTDNNLDASVNVSDSLESNQQGQASFESVPNVENTTTVQAPLEEVQEKPKKKGKLGLIIIIVLVLAVVAYFVFQYISLTNEANKVKNNNANNSQLKNNSDKIVSEDAYETIAHQDENYVEYDFDFDSISDMYENEYTIGNHKVKMSITSDKTGSITINNNKQEINYPIIKIYHLLKSDTLFIENQLFTNDSELYVYSSNSIDNVKTGLNGSQFIEGVSIKDNVLEFTSGSWNESNVFNGSEAINVCQEGYVNRLAEDYAVESVYTFDLKETVYSSDKLKATTKKTVKQFYDEECSVTPPQQTPTEQGPTNEVTPEAPVSEQTPKIETIAPVGQ